MPQIDTVRLEAGGVEAARRARLLTIGELAERASCSVRTLRSARTGRPIGLPTAKRIARALGVGIRSLLAETTATQPGDHHSVGAA
jgi:transcriptional regulator with XRE-family HTH domain